MAILRNFRVTPPIPYGVGCNAEKYGGILDRDVLLKGLHVVCSLNDDVHRLQNLTKLDGVRKAVPCTFAELNRNSLDLVERHLVISPVVELGGAGR